LANKAAAAIELHLLALVEEEGGLTQRADVTIGPPLSYGKVGGAEGDRTPDLVNAIHFPRHVRGRSGTFASVQNGS